jgi:hypothetical protein
MVPNPDPKQLKSKEITKRVPGLKEKDVVKLGSRSEVEELTRHNLSVLRKDFLHFHFSKCGYYLAKVLIFSNQPPFCLSQEVPVLKRVYFSLQ